MTELSRGARLRERAKANADLYDVDPAGGIAVVKISKEDLFSTEQVRTVFDEKGLVELANSIRNHGQLSPIIVFPMNKDGMYRIHQGERRFRAINMLDDMRTVNCIIQDHLTFAQQFTENVQRENLNPFDIANGIATLKKNLEEDGQPFEGKNISALMGKSVSWVSQHESILKMQPELVASLKNKGVNDLGTLTILRKLAKKDFERTLLFINSKDRITRSAAERLLKDIREEGNVNSVELENNHHAVLLGGGTNKNTGVVNSMEKPNADERSSNLGLGDKHEVVVIPKSPSKKQSKSQNKSPLINVTNLRVLVNNKEGFLINNSDNAPLGTINVLIGDDVFNVPVDGIRILGYAS